MGGRRYKQEIIAGAVVKNFYSEKKIKFENGARVVLVYSRALTAIGIPYCAISGKTIEIAYTEQGERIGVSRPFGPLYGDSRRECFDRARPVISHWRNPKLKEVTNRLLDRPQWTEKMDRDVRDQRFRIVGYPL
jgi:hypothetical protein